MTSWLMRLATEVAVAVVVPRVIMLNTAVGTVPIALVKHPAVMVRTNPDRSGVRRTGPVAVVPNVPAIYRVPISSHPGVARTRTGGNSDNTRRRRRAYLIPNPIAPKTVPAPSNMSVSRFFFTKPPVRRSGKIISKIDSYRAETYGRVGNYSDSKSNEWYEEF